MDVIYHTQIFPGNLFSARSPIVLNGGGQEIDTRGRLLVPSRVYLACSADVALSVLAGRGPPG